MKYGEALREIMAGKDVTRWPEAILSFEEEIGLVTVSATGKMAPYEETKEDREAQDWEVVKK